MNGPDPLICANAYDVATARLIEVRGFKGVFVGSSADQSELLALPDQALVTVSEIVAFATMVAANVDIPVVADLDDFGATPLNVYRFAKQANAPASPARPSTTASRSTAPRPMRFRASCPKARMIDNIHAAADARTDMALIARCLAPTPSNSYAEMLDRAAAYAEAGADLVWLGLAHDGRTSQRPPRWSRNRSLP